MAAAVRNPRIRISSKWDYFTIIQGMALCTICDDSFKLKYFVSHVNRHLKKHSVAIELEGNIRIAEFKRLQLYSVHFEVEYGELKCRYCNHIIQGHNSHLLNHLNNIHDITESITEALRKWANRYFDITKILDTVKESICILCGDKQRNFNTGTHMRHLVTVHNGIIPPAIKPRNYKDTVVNIIFYFF